MTAPSSHEATKFAVNEPFAGEVQNVEAPVRFADAPWTRVQLELSTYESPECVADTGNWQSALQEDEAESHE